MSSLMNGTNSLTWAGVSSEASMPYALADVIRRLNSSSRSGSRATSIPPQVLLTPYSMYWFWLSMVRNAISLL